MLTVIEASVNRRHGQVLWKCLCDCGTECEKLSYSVRVGDTQSCGCLRHRPTALIHGHCSNKNRLASPTYRSWQAMMARCRNPNVPEYKHYGQRGIKVCDAWHRFETFLRDMGERPTGKSLDRYPNNNGNYEPGNCRWASPTEQNRNTRGNHRITINGETLAICEWAEKKGIDRAIINCRLQRGWSEVDAVLLPKQAKGAWPKKKVAAA